MVMSWHSTLQCTNPLPPNQRLLFLAFFERSMRSHEQSTDLCFAVRKIVQSPMNNETMKSRVYRERPLSVFPCMLLLILKIIFFNSFKNIVSLVPPHNCRELWRFSCYFYLADVVEDLTVLDVPIMCLLCSSWLVNNLSWIQMPITWMHLRVCK